MHRLGISVAALAVCSFVAFSSPTLALASVSERVGCEECEVTDGGGWCSGCEPDQTFCGAATQYCDETGWNIDCVCADEDVDCPDDLCEPQ